MATQGNATEGGERVNKMKITIEIGGTKREVYCFQREEDFLTVLSVRTVSIHISEPTRPY